jgi:hypothetical protein
MGTSFYRLLKEKILEESFKSKLKDRNFPHRISLSGIFQIENPEQT